MGRPGVEQGPLAGVAEARSQRIRERERAKRDELKGDIAALAGSLNGDPLTPRECLSVLRRVRVGKHNQRWFKG